MKKRGDNIEPFQKDILVLPSHTEDRKGVIPEENHIST
jgi:hypothetical protein